MGLKLYSALRQITHALQKEQKQSLVLKHTLQCHPCLACPARDPLLRANASTLSAAVHRVCLRHHPSFTWFIFRPTEEKSVCKYRHLKNTLVYNLCTLCFSLKQKPIHKNGREYPSCFFSSLKLLLMT